MKLLRIDCLAPKWFLHVHVMGVEDSVDQKIELGHDTVVAHFFLHDSVISDEHFSIGRSYLKLGVVENQVVSISQPVIHEDDGPGVIVSIKLDVASDMDRLMAQFNWTALNTVEEVDKVVGHKIIQPAQTKSGVLN